MLAELRAAGLRFTVDGGTLYVEPASALTDAQRATIREHKASLMRELVEESWAHRKVIVGASDAAVLADFRAALVLGRLHVCCNCAHFAFSAEPAGLGHCLHFNVEAWPFAPFWCSGFKAAPAAVAPAYVPISDATREPPKGPAARVRDVGSFESNTRARRS